MKTRIIGFNDSAIAKIKKYKKNDKLDYFSLKKYLYFNDRNFQEFEDIVDVMKEQYELIFNLNRFSIKLLENIESMKNTNMNIGYFKNKFVYKELREILSKNSAFITMKHYYFLLKHFIKIYNLK